MPRPHGSRDELRPSPHALAPGAPGHCARSPAARRPGERGVTWVGVLLALLLLGGGYLAWVWIPVYQLHYEVKQGARDFANRAVRDPNDEALVKGLSTYLQSLAREQVVAEDGRVVTEPVVRVEPQDITWERREPSQLHIAFAYERQVELPWLKRWVTKPFKVDLTLDVSRPDWGKQ